MEMTEHLQLLKKDPVTDGSDVFNIKIMLNDNWDKIDAEAKRVAAALLNAPKTATYSVSVGTSGWTDNGSGYYTNVFDVVGLQEDDEPIADVLLDSPNASDNAALKAAWALVDRVVAGSDYITVYATAIPTTNFIIRLKVVR